MSVSGLDGLSVASLAAHSLREQTVIKCPGQDAGKRRLWHSELLALHKAWFSARSESPLSRLLEDDIAGPGVSQRPSFRCVE